MCVDVSTYGVDILSQIVQHCITRTDERMAAKSSERHAPALSVACMNEQVRIAGWAILLNSPWKGTTMTENERRAHDTLERTDLIRRAALAGGMIASFFAVMLLFVP